MYFPYTNYSFPGSNFYLYLYILLVDSFTAVSLASRIVPFFKKWSEMNESMEGRREGGTYAST